MTVCMLKTEVWRVARVAARPATVSTRSSKVFESRAKLTSAATVIALICTSRVTAAMTGLLTPHVTSRTTLVKMRA